MTIDRESECDDAILEYGTREPLLGEYERAIEEDRIASLYWRTVLPGGVRAHGKAQWIRAAFEKLSVVVGRAAQERSRIYSSLEGAGGGHRVLGLWKRLEDDMTRATAVLIVHGARSRMHREKLSLEDAVAEEIAIYDSRPHERHVRGGKVVRSGPPKRGSVGGPPKRRTDSDRPSLPPIEVETESESVDGGFDEEYPAYPTPEPAAPPAGEDDGPAALLAKIRFLVLQYVTKETVAFGVGEAERGRLADEMHLELNELLRLFRSRVKSAGRVSAAMTTPFPRAEVVAACTQLTMPVPRSGEAVDLMKARRLFRQQARDHHPDKTDDPRRHELYKKLAKACETLALYNDSLAQRP